jgi:hypothetical protein
VVCLWTNVYAKWTGSRRDFAKRIRWLRMIFCDGDQTEMRTLYGLALLSIALFLFVAPARATSTSADVGFGQLFYNDNIVRTVVTPVATPNQGTDNFYKVKNGATGQLGIAGVAPGAIDYHGGHWKVFIVTFNSGVTPFLLKSQAEVLSAQTAGSVTVTRNGSADFLCPVQP